MHGNSHKHSLDASNTCAILQLWEKQTDFKFGFIPCSEQELPVVTERTSRVGLSFFNTHDLIRATERLSDAVRYVMHKRGFSIIDYIDDYVGVGVPSVAFESFNHLTSLMHELGLTISEKKLVPPVQKLSV